MKALLTLLSLLILNSTSLFAQWTQIGPPGNLAVYSLAVSPNGAGGSNVFAGTVWGFGVYKSTNNGQNWTQSGLNGLSVWSLAVSNSNVFAATGYSNPGVYRSTDNGQSWTQIGPPGNLTVHSLAVSGSNVFAGTSSGGVYFSANNGQTWTQTSFFSNDGVNSLAVSDTIVFAGEGDCTDNWCWGHIYRSTDSGQNWTVVFAGGMISSFAITGSNVFAGFTANMEVSGLILSTNNGGTWTQVSNFSAYSLAISDSNVFAGTGIGVYLSTNNGQTWTEWNQGGLDNKTVRALAVSSEYIFAGTQASSVWRRPLSDIVVGQTGIGSSIPEKYSLYQNYPNPFNPATTIKYALPEASFVTLKIYDILGREITTLVNEKLNAGTYEVEWDASNYPPEGGQVPSGVYFYRIAIHSDKLTSENYSETKRMVLIK